MAISEQDIRLRLERKPKSGAIAAAVKHQDRLKFHIEKTMSAGSKKPEMEFMAFVRGLLTDSKYETFRSLFRYPIVTVPVSDLVFKKLSRIFDGQNPTYNYQFHDSGDAADWERYRLDRLHEPNVWKDKGWEYFKTEINSIVVCDLPREQSGERPEPYFYWVRIEDVLDYDTEHDGTMKHVCYKTKAGFDEKGLQQYNLVCIDDERYRVYEYGVGGITTNGQLGRLLVDNPHYLGYCPARWFWNDSISLDEPDVKESPLTCQLEKLDWYAFFSISKKHLDLYGSYPILSAYEEECDYSNGADGSHCEHGYLVDNSGQVIIGSDGKSVRCPKCGGRNKLDGAGNLITVPIPGKDWVGNDVPDMRNPIQMLSVDSKSLAYNVGEQDRLRDEIINSIVGNDENLVSVEAVNEKQVDASFENQTIVLLRIASGWEAVQSWTDSTCCRLRYGNSFIGCNINYGTRFFLQSVADLWKNYQNAKDTGATESELDAIYDQIIVTEYRTNPQQLLRMRILGDLEPYRHSTREEMKGLYDAGVVDAETYQVKIRFSELLKRFERENINVIEFGVGMPYDAKIAKISDIIRGYVGGRDREVTN